MPLCPTPSLVPFYEEVLLRTKIAALTLVAIAVTCAATRQHDVQHSTILNTAGQTPRFTHVKLQGVASALESRPSVPRAKKAVTTHARRSTPAPAGAAAPKIQTPRWTPPPRYGGSVRAVACSYGWSCAVALCIIDRESGGDPRAYNRSSGAAGWWQFLPFHYRGRFDPFDPVAATRYAWSLYLKVGWSPWHSSRHPCY